MNEPPTVTVVGGPYDGETLPARGVTIDFAFIDNEPGIITASLPLRLSYTAHWSDARIERVIINDDESVTREPYEGPELHR